MKEAGIDLYISWHKRHPLLKILQNVYGVILHKLLFPCMTVATENSKLSTCLSHSLLRFVRNSHDCVHLLIGFIFCCNF